jgi:hypothetical protein
VLAARFSATSRFALDRHRAQHVPAQLAHAQAARQQAAADALLDQVQALRDKALALLGQAEAQDDLRTALVGVREARACLELLAELEQRLDRRPVVNVLVSAEWQRVRGALVTALAPYPQARAALASALVALESA